MWSHSVFRDSGLAQLIVGPAGRISVANPAATTLVGTSSLAGANLADLIAAPDRGSVDAFLAALAELPAGRSQALGPVQLVGPGPAPHGPDDRRADTRRGRVRRPGDRRARGAGRRGRGCGAGTAGGPADRGRYARPRPGGAPTGDASRGPRVRAGRGPRRVRLDQRDAWARSRATASWRRSPSGCSMRSHPEPRWPGSTGTSSWW